MHTLHVLSDALLTRDLGNESVSLQQIRAWRPMQVLRLKKDLHVRFVNDVQVAQFVGKHPIFLWKHHLRKNTTFITLRN